VRTTPRSEVEAQKVSRRTLLKAGWHEARITEAIEKISRRGNDTVELTVAVPAGDGDERTFRDWLTDSTLGAAKLRHCCEAVGGLADFEAGNISQEMFPGHAVQVKIGIQKGTRAYPGDRNVIDDYRVSSTASVVQLRSAG
jgi:hypothetical protein